MVVLDFYSDKYPHLPKLNKLKIFCAEFFRHSALLRPFQANFDKLFEDFRSYVVQVPTCGCILLTPDFQKCLLVRAWKQQSWCFPKGKINEGETAAACAAREVLEEVGYDASGKIHPQNALQSYVYGKKIRMFVVPNVPETSEFDTRTRKEIGEIRWFALAELEALRTRQYQSKFTSVLPFLSKLRRWIDKQPPPSFAPPLVPPIALGREISDSSLARLVRRKHTKCISEHERDLSMCFRGWVISSVNASLRLPPSRRALQAAAIPSWSPSSLAAAGPMSA